MTRSIGPEAMDAALGFQTGPAIASEAKAAIVRRSNSNGQGVLAGVRSCCSTPRSSRTGGKNTSRGAGGVTRNSQ